MIRRSEITVSRDGVTPKPGVYVTVKKGGSLATLYNDVGALIGNPLISGLDGNFSYNIADADAGSFTEEYRISLASSPRTVRAISLNSETDAITALAAMSPSADDPAILTQIGRAGSFAYRLGNYTTQVAADTAQGIYVALAANPSGSAGAWVRQFDGSVNVRWAGPTQNGVANDAPAFTAANAMGSVISVPDGPYLISTAPTLTKIFEFSPGAILTGAAAGAFGYSSSGGIQTIATATAPNQYATRHIRRNANHTGGTPGYVSSALRVNSYVDPANTNFEWAGTFVCDNSATAGENVGVYAQGIKRAGAGPTWGAVSDVVDYSAANPASQAVGHEIDITANGTDSNNGRVALDMVLRKRDNAGATAVAAYGARISNNGTDKFKTGFGAVAGTLVDIGFDTSAMSTAVAAFRMATNQTFQFNAAGTRYMTHTGGALSFVVSGAQAASISDSGAYSVGTNQVVGTRGAAVADATDAASAITQLNLLLARLRASTGHGLIA